MDDREFTAFEELEKLNDEELEKIVIVGVNIHITTSKTSIAQRILNNRRQIKQVEVAKNMEKVTKHLEQSNRDLLAIVGGVSEIVKLLDFLKNHWFPNRSIWFRICAFFIGTVILGIILNLTATAIEKFIFHW